MAGTLVPASQKSSVCPSADQLVGWMNAVPSLPDDQLTVSPHYELGGMGAVYQAHDPTSMA